MNWININVTILDSPEFVGADPTARATWLCLLRYCAGQENGGRIVDARGWNDRKWQQVARVTMSEVETESELWKWDGEDLVVFEYPVEMEVGLKAKRAAGREGGKSSSRAKKLAAKTNGAKSQPQQAGEHPENETMDSSPNTHLADHEQDTPPQANTQANTQRKEKKSKVRVKEGNGKEKEVCEHTHTRGEAWSGNAQRGTKRDVRELQAWINSLHPSWRARPHFSRVEKDELLGNAQIFTELTERDRALLAAYMDALVPPDWGIRKWQPDHRGQLIRHVTDVLSHADVWLKECRRRGQDVAGVSNNHCAATL